jgi:2-polyprenyl-3-methyl-5-hydroxy-6-metoxy-1,4-benzoquinol methylase
MLLGVSGMALWAQNPSAKSPEEEWKAFLAWVSALEPESFPDLDYAALFRLYRATLIRQGYSAAAADHAIARIGETARQSQSFQTLFFDKIYAKDQPGFSADPNAFLVEVMSLLQPGKAVDLGMGDGRNSIFLARLGWKVTGIDLSESSMARARKNAQTAGVQLTALNQDVNEFDFGDQQWELVCMLYFSGFAFVRDLERRIAAGLKPGGYVVFEGPLPTPERLLERWRPWQGLGLLPIRLEYRAQQADWRQPTFGRMLLQRKRA